MTRKLYWEDAYLKEFSAVVKASESNMVIFDQTAFYPTSGGQLNDTGKIISEGKEYCVVDVKEKDGEILHFLDRESELVNGAVVSCSINWERRYALMRYHTALHVLCAVVENNYNGRWKGGMIYTDKAHVDFDLPSLNSELAEKIVEEANRIIKEKHKVSSRFLPKEEAMANPSLAKTEPGRELIKKLDVVRVVEIENFDIQMDGGTHLHNTEEIGMLKLSEFSNKGSNRKRVEISII